MDFVSTGRLPDADEVAGAVDDAYERFKALADGSPSDVYPNLARANPTQFGLCVATVGGALYPAGDVDATFVLMSVAKPFTFALVCETLGADEARRRIGVNATGLSFNAPEAVERSPDGRTNPMVNAGALATVALVPGADHEARWSRLLTVLSAFAGRELDLDEGAFAEASATNHRNATLVRLLDERGALAYDADGTLDLYTRQSCLDVTARDLAVMGATLADGGVNPLTGERVVGPEACRHVLATMATAGLYETSGDWLYQVGLPGKSGIGGGIVTVSPGKGALGSFSPPLDGAGNSVRGVRAAEYLSRRLGLDVFASEPRRS